jgi:hydantoinase/carbamoylase family amidase
VTGRIKADLDALAAFGAGEDGGVTRVAWSPELAAASAWLCEELRGLGLVAGIDAAGNVLGKWETGEGSAVLVGSHLDTVPSGGRFDGALGVVAALDAVRELRERGVKPRRPVWLVSFMDEEGTRFRTGLLGSRAFCGDDLSGLAGRHDSDGVTLPQAMNARGTDFALLPEANAIDGVGAYVELHIEQGPTLEQARVDIGVVTGIVGLLGFRARLAGQANHAGTTPMIARRDALAGAARAVLALREEARRRGDMTANVGILRVEPGGFNVIPGACEFTIDVRSATADGFSHLEPFVRRTLDRIATDEGLELELLETSRLEPLAMDGGMQATIERAAVQAGASTIRLPSGAGHDAMIVGRHVPAAMLFVPSRGGISHSPAEYTAPRQCELGARVLARTLELMVA